jgi:proteasome accessory factor C
MVGLEGIAGCGVSPPLAGSRLRRVLALVPWLDENPGAALDEIAARFGVSEAELEHDLELLPLCGLPPYTPDRLIEVEIVDGHVWIRFAEYFDRPLRLSAEEGLGLLTAGRALLAVPGSDEHGALARALDKLASTLGAADGLAVEVGEPAHLEALRRAAGAHERVEIDYYSFGRNRDDAPDRPPIRFPRLRALVRGGVLPSGRGRAAVPSRPHPGGPATGQRFDPAAGDEPDFGER